MRIHSLSKVIAFPFIAGIGVIMYFLFMEDLESWYPYLFPFAFVLAILYAYSPQIDFWWHKKYPPALDPKIKQLVYKASDFYRQLSGEEKKKYLNRLSIFIYNKAFHIMLSEKEEMPVDMSALIALNAITISFYLEDYLFGHFDYFIAYLHPFPSPENNNLHDVETYFEDGVILCNTTALYESLVKKSGGFNIGLFAFAEAFMQLHPQINFPDTTHVTKDEIKSAGDREYEQIMLDIGLEPDSLDAVLITLYFDNPTRFKKEFPILYKEYAGIFNNPGR